MTPVVEFRHVSKQFGAVKANQDISFSVAKGSIHGIVGENGAGKSTLMSILYGYYQADSGSILLNGAPARIRNSQEAIRQGIGMVHQHFMLVETFTVLENIMLGIEGARVLGASFKTAEQKLRAIAAQYQLDVDPLARIEDLSVGAQQRVEILKLIYRGADILILDEPTAVLTPQEAESLFAILRLFREQGKTIILITHKLQEIMAITDRVTVMRAGMVAGEVDTAHSSREALATLMVGHEVNEHLARTPRPAGDVVLDVDRLGLISPAGVRQLEGLSFQVRAGEIVAIAGVSGNGQTQLLEVLAGMTLPSEGQAHLLGQSLPWSGRKDADGLPAIFRQLGIAHAPEDRLREGLIKDFSVAMNCVLGHQRDAAYVHGMLLDAGAIQTCAEQLIADFDVRPTDPSLRAAQLSGGNQQKIVLGREIASAPKLFLVGQPTRGVDIGSIEIIHRRLLALREAGIAILLVSVELEEIRTLADRVLVMCGGRITGEVRGEDFDIARIGLMMGGVTSEAVAAQA
jgi:general nucleoside transport system ATP-binding protein